MKRRSTDLLIQDIVSETKAVMVFQAIIEVALGVLLIAFPNLSASILCIIIGVFLAGYGVFDIISFLMNSRNYTFRQGLFSGVLMTALGLAFIVQSETLIKLVSIILGILIIIESLVNCRRALLIHEMEFKLWFLPLIFSLLTFAAGLVIIVYPQLLASLTFIIVGITLICEALIDLWLIHRIAKLGRSVKKAYEDAGNKVYIEDKADKE